MPLGSARNVAIVCAGQGAARPERGPLLVELANTVFIDLPRYSAPSASRLRARCFALGIQHSAVTCACPRAEVHSREIRHG